MPESNREDLSGLRTDLETKHNQNRSDIHRLRNGQQQLTNELHLVNLNATRLEGKIMPLVDNGQPGLISRMDAKLNKVVEDVARILIAQGVESGKSTSDEWLKNVLASMIVGLMVALAAHFWK